MTPLQQRSTRDAKPAIDLASNFSAQDLELFGQTIAQHLGHFQDVSRRQDLAAILRLRMRLTGCTLYADYSRLLEAGPEWEALAPLLTVPETYFFRMPSHFDALAEDVLPQILHANRTTRSLRILSAGCATGEEPYSLRILLNERFPQLADWEVAIVGVDLSLAALERARAGVYTEWSLRATAEPRRRASFTPEGKQFRLKPSARADVAFRRENLLAPPPPGESRFDLIFCRNVLIYFTDEAIRVAIARLSERLAPGGYLFLGPAESLRGISDNFQLCQGKDVFYYQLRSPAQRRVKSSANAAANLETNSQTGSPPQLPARASGPTPAGPLAVGSPAANRDGNLYPSPDETVLPATWYISIQQSWQRLAALVPTPGPMPGPAPGITVPPIPGLAALPDPEAAFFALVAAERFAQALDLLESLTASASLPDPAGRNLLRATMLTNLGRYQQAEHECKLLLAANSTHAAAHFLLGLCRDQAGALDEAGEHMATAIYLDPTFPMAHLHRGLIARRQHDNAAARAAFQQALHAIEHDEARRLALFSGGFSRESLKQLCRRELDRLKTETRPLQATPRLLPAKAQPARRPGA